MRIDDDAKVYISWDAELSADPTGSTVELEAGGVRYPAAWLGSPVQVGDSWKQTARTVAKFNGTNANFLAGDVALGEGRHIGQFIVSTADGQVVPASAFPIMVS